jgi:hypothetical protein
MTNLSPAAQAVLDAGRQHATQAWSDATHQRFNLGIISALRAAANQVISPVSPPCEDFDEYAQGFLSAHIQYRDELLAIADELEGVKYGTYRCNLEDNEPPL